MAKKTCLVEFGIQYLDSAGYPLVDVDTNGCEYELPMEGQGVIIPLSKPERAKKKVLALLGSGEFVPVNINGCEFQYNPQEMRVVVFGVSPLTSRSYEEWKDARLETRGGRAFRRRNRKALKALLRYNAGGEQRSKDRRVLAAMRAAKKLQDYDPFLVKRGGVWYNVDQWGWMRKYTPLDIGGDDE